MTKPASGHEKRVQRTLDERAPEVPVDPSRPVPAKDTWRGYVLVPAKGGRTNGWFLRLVEIPLDVVEQYAVPGRRAPVDGGCDQRHVQTAKVQEWLRDPELIREWL